MNNKPWEGFEGYLEEQAVSGKDIHIITGSYGEQARLSSKEIQIPDYFWKIALILKQPGLNLSEIQAADVKNVIAIEMSNAEFISGEDPNSHRDKWKENTKTIEYIEEKTSLIFFSQLPERLAEELKEYQVRFSNDNHKNPIPFI
jgi:DNA/RNA endonuclease G (NUC1)